MSNKQIFTHILSTRFLSLIILATSLRRVYSGRVKILAIICLFVTNVTPATASDDFFAAGCYISNHNGVLVNRSRILQKLQLPMGRRSGNESARQTAARETLEETGIEVSVKDVIIKLDDDRVWLFNCQPKSGDIDIRLLQAQDQLEVDAIYMINPHTMQTADGEQVDIPWRFPQTQHLLKLLFPSLLSQKPTVTK